VLEREVKLAFPTEEEARAAVVAAGAVLSRPRRLQQDTIFDTDDQSLRRQGCAVRVRRDGESVLLTFKGPPQPARVKQREEHETAVADGDALLRIIGGIGLRPAFRYEKYREEYSAGDVVIAIDQTPVGTFVEIEGDEAGILRTAALLGRTPDDFILDSYRTLFLARRESAGLERDMVFPRQ
jgi:adenylate cyclase class 2